MTSDTPNDAPNGTESIGSASQLFSLAHRGVILGVSVIMGIELILLLWNQQWFNAAILPAIMAVILSPMRL